MTKIGESKPEMCRFDGIRPASSTLYASSARIIGEAPSRSQMTTAPRPEHDVMTSLAPSCKPRSHQLPRRIPVPKMTASQDFLNDSQLSHTSLDLNFSPAPSSLMMQQAAVASINPFKRPATATITPIAEADFFTRLTRPSVASMSQDVTECTTPMPVAKRSKTTQQTKLAFGVENRVPSQQQRHDDDNVQRVTAFDLWLRDEMTMLKAAFDGDVDDAKAFTAFTIKSFRLTDKTVKAVSSFFLVC